MRKTRKQIFAEWYIHNRMTATAQMVMNLSNERNLGIQVNTVNSKGDFVIKFSLNEPWINPDEWVHNYLTQVKLRYEEAEAVYRSLFSQEHDDGKAPEQGVSKIGPTWKGKLISEMNLEKTTDGIVFPADMILGKKMIQKTFEDYSKTKWSSPKSLCLASIRDTLSRNVTFDPMILEASQKLIDSAKKS